VVRSNLSAQACGDPRLAPGSCTERLLCLRAAVAEGRYRVDPQAIAAKLIAALDPQLQPIGTH